MRHVSLFYSLRPSLSFYLLSLPLLMFSINSIISYNKCNSRHSKRFFFFALSRNSHRLEMKLCEQFMIAIKLLFIFIHFLLLTQSLILIYVHFLLFTKQNFNHLNNCLDHFVRVWLQLKGKLTFRSSQMHTHHI